MLLVTSLIIKVLGAYDYLKHEDNLNPLTIRRTLFLHFAVGFCIAEALLLIGNLFDLQNYLNYYGIPYEPVIVLPVMFGTRALIDYGAVLVKSMQRKLQSR